MTQLFKAIKLPSEAPIPYVGVYVLRWHERPTEPDYGFVPVEYDVLDEFAKLCREYPNESAESLLEMALTLLDANVIQN